MHTMRLLAVASVVFFRTVAFGAPPTPPTLTVTLADHVVTVSGVSSGADVTIFSDAFQPRQYGPAMIHTHSVLHESGGQVQLALGQRQVERSSVWIAVDNKSGAFGIAKPAGSLFREVVIPSHDLARNGKGDIVKADLPFTIVDLLVVRPTIGSWHGTIADGAPSDDDPKPNGRTGCDVAKLKQLGATEHGNLDKLKNDDVVVGIDPAAAMYFVTRVGGN